jgi:hypothetical protein
MRALRTFVNLALAMLFASCAQVSVVGPDKDMIAGADIDQIKRVVWQASYPRSAELFIRPLGPDAAAIRVGRHPGTDGNVYTLTVRRSGGQWTIDSSTQVAQSFIPPSELSDTPSRP